MPKYTLGHSPDSDDAFMFYGLAKGGVDTGDLEFEHILQDIETLNRRALNEELDITALSVHAYTHVADKYALMSCGASIGDKYGPLVVSRKPIEFGSLRNHSVAVPGTMTTAFLTLRIAIGEFDFIVMPFDQILDAVAKGDVDAGLIIHEGQLTYEEQSLIKVVDLGEWWFDETELPLPLGVNGVRKAFGEPLMKRLTQLVHASIKYGLENRAEAVEYALQYARDLDPKLADQFVGMYVNDFTVDMGESGRQGIEKLLTRGYEAGVIPHRVTCEFITP